MPITHENLARSGVDGVAWPALLDGTGAQVLATQAQLSWSQWWPTERLEAVQLQQLDALVRHAHAQCATYRQRLDALGYDPRRPLDWATFRRMPLLTRRDLQDDLAGLSATAVPPDHGRRGTATTSGSTGQPVTVEKTELNQHFWRAITLRDHLWHRRDLSAPLAQIRHVGDASRARPPHGERTPHWGPSVHAAFDTGPSPLLAIRSDADAQAQWVLDTDAPYLLTYPSALAAILDRFEASGARPTQLKQVLTVSEMVPPGLRARCLAILGVPLVDVYSTQEVGYIALQCPEHDHLHIQAETVHVEVLKDDGTACAPGEIGRVVVTPLHAFATPLLRYDIGDYAEVGAPCPCGRGLPVLRRVMGRVRQLLHHPDGTTSWPVFADHRFRELAPIRQYRVVQHDRQRLSLRVVVDRPLTQEERTALADTIVARLGSPFRIDVIEVDDLPRSASGKYEDFVSEVRA